MEAFNLDARQLARIEAVHRSFLYQHLYAAACLFCAASSGVTHVVVENDEDVELVLPGRRVYAQIKRADRVLSSVILRAPLRGSIRFGQSTPKAGGAALANSLSCQTRHRGQTSLNVLQVRLGRPMLLSSSRVASPAASLPEPWETVSEASKHAGRGRTHFRFPSWRRRPWFGNSRVGYWRQQRVSNPTQATRSLLRIFRASSSNS